jgi:hypothetical protein
LTNYTNLSSLANDCGITHNTARSWLTVLEASYIVFLLPPYFRNFGKRIVKTPKIFFFDPGLAAWLIGVKDREHLAIHPMRGPLFESFAIAEIVKGFLHAYEIKSGKTVSADYFRGLKRFSAIASGARVRPEVIYAGEEESTRDGIPVRPWKALPKAAAASPDKETERGGPKKRSTVSDPDACRVRPPPEIGPPPRGTGTLLRSPVEVGQTWAGMRTRYL